jgi:hypothetical protein
MASLTLLTLTTPAAALAAALEAMMARRIESDAAVEAEDCQRELLRGRSTFWRFVMLACIAEILPAGIKSTDHSQLARAKAN